MKTDREKIEILVDLLSDRQWDYEPDDGRGSYSYCQECGANNRGPRHFKMEADKKKALERPEGLVHEPNCKLGEALGFTTSLFSVVALMRQNGAILAVSRKDNHEDFGLPGGKIDPGETPEKAIAREMDEEVGCQPRVMFPVFEHLDRVVGDKRRPCRCYLVLEWEGTPRPKEGARVEWVRPGRLLEPSCSFHEYNRKLFEAVLPLVV
jgi:mutator protein MutT